MYAEDLQKGLFPTYKLKDREKVSLTIDAIEKHVVARLKIETIVNKLTKVEGTWEKMLIDTIEPQDHMVAHSTKREQRWCGIDLDSVPSPCATRPRFEKIFDEVKGSLLIEMRKPHKEAVTSVLFLVPKTKELSRIVLDGRELNERCGKPPNLQFITMNEIFRMVSFFPRPAVATGDFRHWFYQIPLNPRLQHLFSLECNGRYFQQKAWAMGFSWSPFVAQAISMSIAKWGITREPGEGEEKWFAIPSSANKESPPTFWFVSNIKAESPRDIKRENILGFVSFWYDNLLIITRSTRIRERLLRTIDAEAQTVGALWKETKKTEERPAIQKDAFTRSVNGGVFMGISFSRDAKGWWWNHIEENRLAWREAGDPPFRTWRAAARITGILTWDWLVSNRSKSDFQDVLEISRAIGKGVHDQWDRLAPQKAEGGLTAQHWVNLKQTLHRMCDQERRDWPCVRPGDFGQHVLLASDAMDVRGAGLDLSTGSIVALIIFDQKNMTKHINWKETKTALMTIRNAAKIAAPKTKFLIAVDNTTARTVLNTGCAPWDKDLDLEIRSLRNKLLRRGSDFESVYVPGIHQPADEPSRLKRADKEKIAICRKMLEETSAPWWETVNK